MAPFPPSSFMRPMDNGWIREGLKRPGKTQAGLARAMGLTPQRITDVINDRRRVQLNEAAAAAKYLGVPLPIVREHSALRMIPVVGRVAAGVWLEHEPDANPEQTIPIALPGYERASLFALKVEGTSMNLHYPEGSFVICCPAQEAGIRHGDHVIVERRRNGLVETTIKELVIEGGRNWLWPRSSDPKHQTAWELVRHSESQNGMAITGVVVSAYSVRGRGTGPVME